jgi:hypothetical protein
MDFISYWAAAKLALAGNPSGAYDIETHRAVQLTVAPFTHTMPFPYPPPFLFIVLPFGLLPYAAATAAWVALTFLLYLSAGRRIDPRGGWVAGAFPPVLVNGIIGQNGLLTSAIFMHGLSMLQRRPFVGGALLGCLIIKPQLAILLPLAFIAAREWKAFMGAALSSSGLLLAAYVAFGAQSYLHLARLMPLYGSIAADGLVGWHKMGSVYAALRMAGLASPAAWTTHILVALAAVAATWLTWRAKHDVQTKAAVILCASTLISPYLYIYDEAMLLLPLLWLVARGANRWLLVLLWSIALSALLQTWLLRPVLNLMPLMPIGMLVLIFRHLQDRANPAERSAKGIVVQT